jgi:hypothetical protein
LKTSAFQATQSAHLRPRGPSKSTLVSGDCYAASGMIVHSLHAFKGAATRFEEVPGTRYQPAPFDSVGRRGSSGSLLAGNKNSCQFSVTSSRFLTWGSVSRPILIRWISDLLILVADSAAAPFAAEFAVVAPFAPAA